MDFYKIKTRNPKKGTTEVYPDFINCRSHDLMVRGGSFYAIWDEKNGLWSTDEYLVPEIVDKDIRAKVDEVKASTDGIVKGMYLSNDSSGSWRKFVKYCKILADNFHQLDTKVTFENSEVQKKDYVSKRLKYSIKEGECKAYTELSTTLYNEEELRKLEWCVGSIVSGDSKSIQKFAVLYGEAGAGKSTMLNIIQDLFEGYYTIFEAKALVSSNNQFSTEVFKDNPLVAIQHDGDLSRIEDNTKLNSISSHEEIVVNEKMKKQYPLKMNAFLFMATNKPVKITDSKSGIIRRLIDIHPSGKKFTAKKYQNLMDQIPFELGAIANHCLKVYQEMGKNYYNSYRPLIMISETDVFFNFMEEYYPTFKNEDGTTLRSAYEMYKVYCEDSFIEHKLPKYKFKTELMSYFKSFSEMKRVGDNIVRSYFSGFRTDKFESTESKVEDDHPSLLSFDSDKSIFDEVFADCKAQYGNSEEKPVMKWADVTSKLSDIDTKKLHYVRVPNNLIVIDFDIKDEKGNKSFDKNLEAASKWPLTYAELSKSGQGIHLHYYYDGDISKLSRVYSEDVEVKVFNGNSSLRRKLTRCNNSEIATISNGLPIKEEKVVDFKAIENEKQIRSRIKKCLKKEHHGATKPEVDFIYATLEDAYKSGISYDVRDLRPSILAFANGSTHQALTCIKLVNKMKFCSEDKDEEQKEFEHDKIIFFDVEVFPNLFVVVWKAEDGEPVKMINPISQEIEELIKYKLVGFNNRRYDNHILYARLIGYDNKQLYNLSQRIVKGDSKNCFFKEAYNLSYTDIYDFSSKKQSLKKFEIELGIHHQELGLKWDKEVPEELWETVADYCINDVLATEAVWKDRQGDFTARQILAEIAGGTVNDTTNTLTTKFIFGKDRNPELVYTDLATGKMSDGSKSKYINSFPGYEFKDGKNLYRGEDVGFGGFVWAQPGMYTRTTVLDISSMHPHSMLAMNYFGKYTERFGEIVDLRVAIKEKNFKKARKMLNGAVASYLDDESKAKALAGALKIAINSCYGLTSASFDNPMRDKRNKNNIVALRGALFMITLRDEIIKMGYHPISIKTDSIKIVDADDKVIAFAQDLASKYGYEFEIENIFEKICLVNASTFIAKCAKDDPDMPGKWYPKAAQFQQPYVFKYLFSKEPIEFEDMCETKSVTSSLYLDMNEGLPEDQHNYRFVGKVGSFCPIKSGCGGGLLMREKDGKYNAATGTKGYRWLESEIVKELHKEKDIDITYYRHLVDEAIKAIELYGDFEWFAS